VTPPHLPRLSQTFVTTSRSRCFPFTPPPIVAAANLVQRFEAIFPDVRLSPGCVGAKVSRLGLAPTSEYGTCPVYHVDKGLGVVPTANMADDVALVPLR